MKYPKILKYDEFEQLQDAINHCHLLEVASPFIRFSRDRRVLVESNYPDNKDENMIILPTKIECNDDSIQKVSRIVQKYIDSLKGECVDYSIGNYFSGNYESNGYFWTESSICVGLSFKNGNLHHMVIVATNLMKSLKINRIIALSAEKTWELSKDDAQKRINRPTKVKRIGE